MTGDEIKALLDALGLTARTLAAKLGVDAKTVLSWQAGETFPTKRHVDAMRALRATHEATHEKEAPERAAVGAAPVLEALADPAVWALLRKVLAYPALRKDVEAAAAKYRDPAA